jgi:HAD superfamily hydrolase (TIGR01549 family)
MIKLVIFDLWDTIAYKKKETGSLKNICNVTYGKKHYRKFLKQYEQTFQTQNNIEYKKGFKILFKKLKIPFDEKKINLCAKQRIYYQSNFKYYSYIFPLLKKLKQEGYKTALLSNTSSYMGEKILKSKLKKSMDKIFFSYQLGVIKPHKEAFKKVVSYFKIKPSEALMIGNNKIDDYQAAKKLGLNAIHFKNGVQLKKDLKKMGVL